MTYTTGRPLYLNLFEDDQLWTDLNNRAYHAGLPFSRLDSEAGNPSPTFQTWIQHPELDAYWRRLSPSKGEVAGVKLPMLTITGTHDDAQMGVMSYLADLVTTPEGTLPSNYYLVIGPWNHFGTRGPTQNFDGEHFGPASLVDLMRLHLEWYRYAMLGGPRPAFLKKHVAYYVSGEGAECWKYADTVAGVTQRTQKLYLNAVAGAGTLRHAGTLQESAVGATGGMWISDPTDLSHAEASNALPGDDLHGEGLVFQSLPMAQATEIDGQAKIKLSLAIDGPDADIDYRLYLVTPDGKAHWLTQAAVRARYRHSLTKAELVTPGAIDSYDLGPGQWFAIRAPQGSRLRLVLESINRPDTEKNWNSAKPVAEQTSADAHRETIRLVQTVDHPSTLTLPLGDLTSECVASNAW